MYELQVYNYTLYGPPLGSQTMTVDSLLPRFIYCPIASLASATLKQMFCRESGHKTSKSRVSVSTLSSPPRQIGGGGGSGTSPRPSATRPAYRFEAARVSSQSEFIEAVDAHHLDITRVSRQVETDHDDQIGQHQDAPLEVVTLALAVDVAEQEHTEDNGHHVPLREDEVEGVFQQLLGINVPAVDGAEEDEGGNLEEAHLESIGRADLHGKRNVAIHGERDGVLCTKCKLQSLLSFKQ